jgi:K+-transporting ATPase ATPase B chain
MAMKENKPGSLLSGLSGRTLLESVIRLNPVSLRRNPVMLIVEITFFIVTAMAIYPQGFLPVANVNETTYYVEVAVILLITVWFSTLSDSLAERQAKITANSLRQLEREVLAKKISAEGDERAPTLTPSSKLRKGDLILLEKGDTIPIDSEVIEGIAMVDESLLTGESVPVRKAATDPLIGGSKLISDTLKARVTVNPEDSYINQMIRLVEASKRPKTPNEQAVEIVLITLTAIFTIIIFALLALTVTLSLGADLSVLIALYVCLLPTTIGALLPAIGISGMSRLYARKIVAKSGRAIETAGDTDTILLDKTGTITVGSRQAIEFIPFGKYTEQDVGEAAFLSSWHDDTPEGRSIIRLAYNHGLIPKELNALALSESYEFSATTRTSGVKFTGGTGFMLPKAAKSGFERSRFRRKFTDSLDSSLPAGEVEIIKGAPDAIKAVAQEAPEDFDAAVTKISQEGDSPVAICKNRQIIGMIRLRDILKEGIKEKVHDVMAMGIRPIMITGDHPLTAKSIAAEVGIQDFIPQAKPEDKHQIVLREQANTRIVAMIGDGTNDAPALAVADVGLAMNSGTQAAKEAANMVDLESNPSKIIEVVMLGKQLLMTRGAITTFSIANDVSKYFAIVPVLFSVIPELEALNILGLGLRTAVLSALIFNAVIIPLLIPLAMRGVSFKPTDTMTLFLKNTMIYGVGGVIVPFIGIKLIDIILLAIHI